ncbi:hypothetical protein OGV71_01040 [Citrobacter sp. Cf088]|uniref:hypothetical protein n=1 Tax=Citrobacter sp. Cf088 TaxID=2985055 RepID=UPI002578FE73|nr:hypothetical protein [Citrobacter sp. Cf088]MDM3220330.1 hypothetical protein [Citrobacter sp. Cf088]
MSYSPSEIKVFFENNPEINSLIPNPIFISDSPFISALNQKLNFSTQKTEDDDFYRVIFKKDSSRDLMTINSGELKGLLTSTCIEKGKISSVAGLKKVELDNQIDIMPTLLGISLFSTIRNNLSYISQLCVDIRNHQIIEEQARFERISETIVDSFKCIPDISLDRSMRDVYLSRIVKNNDDCYEMYITQRCNFSQLLLSQPQFNSTGYNHFFIVNGYNFYPSDFFESKVLKHPVFAVFERLVAGRICEIVLSGNYSESNVQRHKSFISRACDELKSMMDYRLNAFNNFTNEQEHNIESDLSLNGYDLERLKGQLLQHNSFVKMINKKISELLVEKLMGFNILSHLVNRDEIHVFIVDGKLIINDIELSLAKDE